MTQLDALTKGRLEPRQMAHLRGGIVGGSEVDPTRLPEDKKKETRIVGGEEATPTGP